MPKTRMVLDAAGLLNGLAVATKLRLGFAAMLGLLVAVGAMAWLSADRSLAGIDRVAAGASVALFAARADTELMEARLAVERFLGRGEERDVARFAERNAAAHGSLLEAHALGSAADGAMAYGTAAGAILAAQDRFAADFAELVRERHAIDAANARFARSAEETRKLLAEARAAETEGGDMLTMAAIADAGEQFLLARLEAMRFAADKDGAVAERVLAAIGGAKASLNDLRGLSIVPGQSSRLTRAAKLVAGTAVDFDGVVALTRAMEERVDGSMAATGDAIASQRETLRAGAADRQRTAADTAHWTAVMAIRTALALPAAALVVGAGLSWLIARSIARPIRAMTAAMGRLADGDCTVAIPALGQRNEVGAMAAAVAVFRNALVRTRAMEQDARDADAARAQERRDAMLSLADRFERRVLGIVAVLATATTAARDSSVDLSAMAGQTVADATGALAASVDEIDQRIGGSTQVAHQAAQEAHRTRDSIDGLVRAAGEIDQIIALITGIAGQTNLLALNATIEAARAGDAGRGFAIVAQEVKALALQTALATDSIQGKMVDIKDATARVLAAIDRINGTIGQMNGAATAIAAAVEKQGGALREIAHSVRHVTRGAADASANIAGVERIAAETGLLADHVRQASQQLTDEAAHMHSEVSAFIASIRSA